MFGYVTICKDCMTEAEYNAFLSYYCGLCREMGRQCSQIARLGLSYDITFLALMLAAIDTDDGKTETFRCAMHPKSKRISQTKSRSLTYAANMGALLSYLKLYDDFKDDKSIKAVFKMAGLYRGAKKAKKRYPNQYSVIIKELERLNNAEKLGAGVDEAADCFAKILESLFVPDYITDAVNKKVLGWLGYNVGRWIYVIDAYNDIKRDIKTKNYNPFLKNGTLKDKSEKIREKTEFSLTLNLEAIASAYDLLTVYRNDDVIKHILYTGLPAKQKDVLGENNESV